MFLMPNMRKGIRCLAPCANDQARAHPVAAAGLVFRRTDGTPGSGTSACTRPGGWLGVLG